ncbi:H/ACA ribonucleoprotein complex non-core subunit NAF1 isoform X1 [Leptopilina heterotoma]|uniref:H/ACA ribonucleoprotein complex non-core subunit NAF1 isoform X1 n=2 Tax=Leptopilina heterotoma TaxID=63436 RepID=UPI001CA937F4|nr:H/ACA ribonucleoprotein complex non-core subunit NAF1 isoform X1 [Leptopilina heterotoma]
MDNTLDIQKRIYIMTMEVDLEKPGNLEESITELARNEIDSVTSSNKNVSETEKSLDSIYQDNKIETHLNSDCAPIMEKQNHNEANCQKTTALSSIAMDYYSSDSEMDEVNNEDSQMELVTNEEQQVNIITNKNPPMETVSNKTQEVEVINNKVQEVEIISKQTQEVEIISNETLEVEIISKQTQEVEIISNKTPDIEIVINKTQEVEKISHKTPEVEIISHKTPEVETISNKTQEVEIVSNEKVSPEIEIISHERAEVSIIDKEISEIEINSEVEVLKEYRSHNEITCSSDEVDSEEDSSSSSSSDDSESSSDSESLSVNSVKSLNENKKIASEKGKQRVRRQSKGEFDDLPPIEDLNINVPEVLCDPLGEVAWIVDQMVVVRPKPGKPTLNLESILFIERGRRVLGRVFDVFGQVSDPHYCVRFNNSKHIQENNIKVGMNVYFCPNTEYTSVVFLHELTKMKASDPTDDDEPPQFSDDEEEQAYYQNLRKQQKSEKAVAESGIPTKKKRTSQKSSNAKKNSTDWKSHHPWNTKRNIQNNSTAQRFSSPQDSYSQNWYGATPPYQQNPWPPYPVFPNPAWSMYYPSPNYRGFRPQMGFPSSFQQSSRFSNSMTWNTRSQAPSSQNLQSEAEPTITNSIALSPPPPPPPPSIPPPNPSPPGM